MTDDTQILADPAVEAFVDQVRSGLDDLSADQREELLDGLAADLTEQLADGAQGVLDDPASYAAELRAAAGLPEQRRGLLPRAKLPTRQRVEAVLDGARSGWWRRVGDAQWWEVAEAMRPAWWVARAWVAVTLVDQATGWWETVSIIPSFDVPGLGLGLLAVAVVGSVLVGMGRLWPGSGPERSVLARVVLLGLNCAAIVAPLSFSMSFPGYLDGGPVDDYSGYEMGYHAAQHELADGGLRSDGDLVRNVFAYDAAGRPLVGVQLFDQDGRPLALTARQAQQGRGAERTVGCAWRNGTSLQPNVFPLAQRRQRYGACTWTEGTGPRGPVGLPSPPLAAVPPVAVPDGVPDPADGGREMPRDERQGDDAQKSQR